MSTDNQNQPGWLQRQFEALIHHIIAIPIMALLVFILALIGSIARHVKTDSFIDSLLWLLSAWSLCYLASVFILIFCKIGFYRFKFSSEINWRESIAKFGRAAIILTILSVVLLALAGAIEFHEYTHAHRMDFIVENTSLATVVNEPTSSAIILKVKIINNGPSSSPFNWKMQLLIPEAQPFISDKYDWDKMGLNTNLAYFAATNNLAAVARFHQ